MSNELDPTVPLAVKKLTQRDVDRILLNAPTSGAFKGKAVLSTNPGTPTVPNNYIASVKGSYPYFLDASDQPLVVLEDDGFVTFDFLPSDGFWTKTNTPIESVPGPIGPKGDTGSQGPRGYTGADGNSLSGASIAEVSEFITKDATFGAAITCRNKERTGGNIFVNRPSDAGLTVDNGIIYQGANSTFWEMQFDGHINPMWFGAVGDGTNDDSTVLNSAFSKQEAIYLPDDKAFYAPTFSPSGINKIFGRGKIITDAAEGGQKQLNYVKDIDARIDFGLEYLTYWLSKSTSGTAKIVFSGDSTTAGATIGGDEALPYVFNRLLINDGIAGISVVNSGFAGKNTQEWIDNYLDADLASNPDLYVVRWGINDTPRGVDAFVTSLRTGLESIRASKSIEEMSILLMAPNSISNSLNDNDEEWILEILPHIRQAARDFKCGFIDTYSFLTDSRTGKDYYFDDLGVHPKGTINKFIASKIYDFIIPISTRLLASGAKVFNEPDSFAIATADMLPQNFKVGICINRTDSSFPLDGYCITIRSVGNGVIQYNYGYSSTLSNYSVRVSVGNTWGAWRHYISTTSTGTPSGAWTSPDGIRVINKDGVIYLDGDVRDGSATTGSVICTIPYGPKRNQWFICASSYDSKDYCTLKVQPDGQIIIVGAPASNQFISLAGISFVKQDAY